MVQYFWAKIETEYLGFIVGSGDVRTSPAKLATVKAWPLPETEKQVKPFVVVFLLSKLYSPLSRLIGSIDGLEPKVFTRSALLGYYSKKTQMVI